MACEDRQLTEAQRQAGYQSGRTGVQQAVRPFTGRPTIDNLIDYINRELQPAVRRTRDAVNEVYLPAVDNAPSGNPLGYFFSTETANADPTTGRIRLDNATQDSATTIRVSESNGRLAAVAPWLDVMAGGATTPLGVVTLSDAVNPARFIRFDLNTMTDAGAYWNLGVTPIESSHDSPFVDGSPVIISFIPGVGGSTPATVPASSISGADGPRQFVSTSTGTTVDFRSLSAIAPGAPIYDVMAYPFNAAGNGVADDTSAINAAIAAANTTPGTIYLGPIHRITATLTTLTGNNITIQGRGEFNGGSRIAVDSASAIDVLTLTGQYQVIDQVWFVGIRVYTSGWAIRIRNAFRARVSRCIISQLCFGVEVFRSVLTYVDKVNLDDIYGVFAFWAGGDSGGECHATTFRSCTYGTGMPGGIVGAGSAWAPSTAYVVGNVVTVNSAMYQAVQAGTSAAAGSGPSGIPGATNATVHTAQITDGTVKWVFAMPAAVGFLQSSYCHTVELIDCGTLQGLYGVSMEDPANTGGSYPAFLRVRNLQCDHPQSRGVRLAAGGAARLDCVFVTSVFGGVGIEVGSGFQGNWEFVGGEVFGCSEAGVVINKGDGALVGMQIGAVGSASRDAIEVGNSAARWSIVGCSAGRMFASTSPASRYGLSIAAGCDHYAVIGNRFEGNVTGSILNTPGRSDTRLVLHNIPDTTVSLGSFWGLQCDASGAAVPVEVTCAEATENLRRRTIQTVSGVSGNLDIQLDDDTTVLLIRSTADVNLRTLEDSSGLGDGREIVIEHDRLSGSGNLTVAHNSAGTYVAFFNPNTANIVLGQTTCLQVRARSGFWRPQGSAGTRVADADYGDITVSSVGTVWTIDNSVVTNAKRADMAQSRISGRAEGAGTGAPTDLTPTQVVAIIDAEAVTWTGSHTHNGANHTIAASAILTMQGDSDVGLASVSGGLALGAGHVVVSPAVGNGDVIINATSGVAINAHATTPVTSSADGVIALTASTDLTMASSTGGAALGAGHVVTNPGNGDVVINATSGVAINAHATTPVTTAATGDVVITASDDITLTATDQVIVDGDNIILRAGGDQQLQIEPAGTWLMGSAADSGSFGDALTSQGPDAPPVWQPSGLAGMTALTEHTNTAAVFAAFTAPTIPANSWAAGTVYEFVGEMEIDAATTATSIVIDIGVTGGSHQDLVIGGSALVNKVLSVRGFLTCLTTGAGGTCMIVLRVFSSPNGDADIDVSDSCAIDGNADRASVALDTTVSNTLFMTSKFASAIAGLRHTWQAAFVRKAM